MVRVCSALEFRQGLSFCAVRAIWALAGISDVAIALRCWVREAESGKALARTNLLGRLVLTVDVGLVAVRMIGDESVGGAIYADPNVNYGNCEVRKGGCNHLSTGASKLLIPHLAAPRDIAWGSSFVEEVSVSASPRGNPASKPKHPKLSRRRFGTSCQCTRS